MDEASSNRRRGIKRRAFIASAGVAAGGAAAGSLLWHRERRSRTSTAIVDVAGYGDQARLAEQVRRGLEAIGFGGAQVARRSVLLKPNLVEPARDAPQINTHPTLIRAVAEVFRRWDAREVLIGEGQGHVRDTDFVLEQSGLGEALGADSLPFVDLNHDDVFSVPNTTRLSKLERLTLPRTLERCDLLVSLPKLKTHHWAGVTLSQKNLFGVMPGVFYGWPKNVLHHAGLQQAIVDIAAAVKPQLAIVDGIIGMEGDGPIMGQPRPSGVIVCGENLAAVDATCARLMAIPPERVTHLALASGLLGPIKEAQIDQRGESLTPRIRRYKLLPALEKLLRAS